MPNKLTIFSNGLAQITKEYKTPKVTIACKRANLADALASLDCGNVRMIQPPTYQLQQNGVLTLNGNNVFKDLVTAIRGQKARVKLRNQNSDHPLGHEVHILGIQKRDIIAGETVVADFQVSGINGSGEILTWNSADITSITPTDPEVVKEIVGAVNRAAATLKPESVPMEFTVENSGPFHVQYMVPTSAWQSLYQIRLKTSSPGRAILIYKAKVDNPTDESLDDFIVSCVVGEPNSFKTTLAEVVTVQRETRNLVKERAQGAVNAMTDLRNLPTRARGGMEAGVAFGYPSPCPGDDNKSLMQMAAGDCELESVGACNVGYGGPPQAAAVDAEEGDFAIFTTKEPVSLPPNTSSLITLLCTECEGRSILLYKPEVNSNHPFRAVQFKNTTGSSLGSGVVTFYIDDVFAGQAELAPMKPNQERTLPHCLENGVRVIINPPGSKNERAATRQQITVRNGLVEIKSLLVAETTYNVRNYKTEAYKFRIEHTSLIHNAEVTCEQGEVGALSGGWGVTANLNPTEAVDVVVREHKVESHSLTLTVDNAHAWFRDTLQVGISTNSKIPAQQIQSLTMAYESLFKAQQEERDALQEANVVKGEQARLSELLKTSQQGEQADEWRQEQAANEKSIRDFERKKIPSLHKAVMAARTAVDDEIKKISITI